MLILSPNVTSITGTANQVVASSPSGNVTLSLPQSIATSSSPTFAGETLTGALTGTSIALTINSNVNQLQINNTFATFDQADFLLTVTRTSNVAFRYIACYANYPTSPDADFLLQGDGNALADGTWTGGGADYAEYFETVNGQSINPGKTVILEGDKVREAQEGEAPFGVVRPENASTVLGNAAGLKWIGKFQRDEYGAYVLDENGDRIPSGNFDAKQEYIPRSKRPEWVIIGLMGRIAINKNQVVNPRWIKMKEQVNTDLYLVY